MVKHFNVTIAEVELAWKSVRQAKGTAGIDEQTIVQIEANLESNLYKIWNRLSSGSYHAQTVLLVEIPKAKGGTRTLGIPTVSDRIAQTVIANRLTPITEEIFHQNSYAYRPKRSTHDAIAECRKRCFKYEWLIELDIKGFFDNIDHQLTMEILKKYTQDKVILLYSERFLKAKGGRREPTKAKGKYGIEEDRTCGTPQGGVVSPVLANLYLHEAFDLWMQENQPENPFERYADDIIIHCKSEDEAKALKLLTEERLKQFKLSLHPTKTRIVYTGRSNQHDHRKHDLNRKFTFLGYDFKPRLWKDKLVFTPAIGSGALKMINLKIKREWNLSKRISQAIEEIAATQNSIIRGWINYYGKFRRSELESLAQIIDQRLTIFLKKKYKLKGSWKQGWNLLNQLRQHQPKLFCHWHMICQTRRAV